MSNPAQIKAQQNQAVEMAQSHVESYAKSYTSAASLQSWLGDTQIQQLETFKTAGFPTTRPEKWRFTNIAPLARQEFSAPQKRLLNSAVVGTEKLVKGATTLVFVDGILHPKLSELAHLPSGVRVVPLSEGTHLLTAEQTEQVKNYGAPLEALNAGFLTDGVIVQVTKNAEPNTPLEFLFLTTGANEATHSRTFVALEEGASLTLFETFASTQTAENSWHNNVAHVCLGQNSTLKLVRTQNMAKTSFFTSSVHANISRDATFDAFVANLGSKIARTHVTSHLLEQGSHFELGGFALAGLGQHHNVTTTTHHTVQHTTANQCVRNVVAGNGQRGGHGVFLGQYLVGAEALYTDASMLCQNLLLGARAKADYKPELEIFADDVKCNHGATTGRLDDDQLFYLQQRGLTPDEAKALLTEAFVAGLIETLGNEQAEEVLKTKTRKWLKTSEEA